ncbi:MAG: hypothetical protein ACRDTQ_07790 [Micromonosporaceae bacterium]
MTQQMAPTQRADHLVEVLDSLYPPPCRVVLTESSSTAAARRLQGRQRLGRDAGPQRGEELIAEFRIVPGLRRPRLLTPARPRLAAAGLRSMSRPTSRAAQLGLALGVVGMAVPGAASVLLPHRIRVYGPRGVDCFSQHVQQALEHQGARVAGLAIHIGGPMRANRKPVMALLDPAGRVLGFSKLGVSSLARNLVRNERTALRTLASSRLRHTRLPGLLHAGIWRDCEVIVQSALPVPRRASLPRPGSTDPDVPALSMREVARCCGVYGGPLASSPYWSTLRGRIAALHHGNALAGLADLIQSVAGDVSLQYGAWHGDWTTWNSCQLDDRMLVWDWERFAVGVPLGFDALHCRIAGQLSRPELTISDVLAVAQELTPFETRGREAAVTSALHLLEIGVRYLADGQRTGAAGTVLDRLLPALAAHLYTGRLDAPRTENGDA